MMGKYENLYFEELADGSGRHSAEIKGDQAIKHKLKITNIQTDENT